MDLNINNYSLSNLINLFNICENNIDLKELDTCLSDKISKIKLIDEELPEKKEDLMDFYTKAYFQIKKNIDLKNYNSNEISKIHDYEKSNNNIIYNPNPEQFINVREKLLQPLQNGPTVRENNNYITKHNEHQSLNTFNSNLKYGDINPLTRKSLKKMLNINTKFRNNYTTTSSTNFITNWFYIIPIVLYLIFYSDIKLYIKNNNYLNNI